jgi:hypothetical protein
VYLSVIIRHTLIPNLSRSKNFVLRSFHILSINGIWAFQNPTKTEGPPLGGPDPQLRLSFGVKWQQDICLSSPRDKEDPNIFRTILKIYVIKTSIGRRTLVITMICLGCTTCTIIYKFLKLIKIYLFQLVH